MQRNIHLRDCYSFEDELIDAILNFCNVQPHKFDENIFTSCIERILNLKYMKIFYSILYISNLIILIAK